MAKKNFSNDLLRDLHAEPIHQLISLDEETTEISILSSDEKLTLNAYEEIIEKGLKTFIEVGNALFEIKNNKLYRESFTTFEAYCKDRWQLKILFVLHLNDESLRYLSLGRHTGKWQYFHQRVRC